MPAMKSLRSFRLVSTKGHILQVVANKPINVPPKLEADALAAGMVPVDEVVNVVAPKAEEADPQVDVPVPDPDEDNPDEVEDHLAQAIMIVLTRNDPDDFKADGTPRVNKVNAELPPQHDRVTSTEVVNKFQELQDNIDLAE